MNIGNIKMNAEHIVRSNLTVQMKVIKLKKLKLLFNIGCFFLKIITLIFPCKVEIDIKTEIKKIDNKPEINPPGQNPKYK